MAARFERDEGAIPDTIPDALVAELGADARRTVTASIRRERWWASVAWEALLIRAVMTTALAGIVAALALLMVAFPILGRPLVMIAIGTAGVTLAAGVLRRHAGR